METSNYEISVASNVSDVKLTATVHIDGTDAPNPYESMPAYESGRIMNITDAEFEQLLGHKIPDGKWGGTLTANDAICQLYYAKSAPARLVYRILTNMKDKAEASGKPDMNIAFIYNMPFRAIGKMAGGMVSDAMVEDILLIVNGHFFRGVGRVIVDFFKNMSANKAFTKKLEG